VNFTSGAELDLTAKAAKAAKSAKTPKENF